MMVLELLLSIAFHLIIRLIGLTPPPDGPNAQFPPVTATSNCFHWYHFLPYLKLASCFSLPHSAQLRLESTACNEIYRSQCYPGDGVFGGDEIEFYLVDGSTVRFRK